jgi:hypothetical protein
MFESLLFRPNFPTQPRREFDFFTFPNDLITDNRKYYTEIQFFEYSAGSLADIAGGAAVGSLLGGPFGAGIGAGFGATDAIQNGFQGQGIRGNADTGVGSLGLMKLPIPQRINDSISFSWGEDSIQNIAASLLQNSLYSVGGRTGNILQNIVNVGGALGKGAQVLSGYAINPLFFQTFQHQNFREFSFQWSLAPRTRTESATIASMITLLKRAASPAKAKGTGGFILEYPAIAMIRFSPNDLNGGMKMKPCIITNIAVDHTPVAGPAFFKGDSGAPVVVGISISVKELQLWYREDYYDQETQNQISQNVPAFSGIRDDRQTPVNRDRDDRAPGTR